MVPSTGQSSLPRSAVVMEPGALTPPRSAPRAASSRRARSSEARSPFSRDSSFWSSVSRRSVFRAERCRLCSLLARSDASAEYLLASASRSSRLRSSSPRTFRMLFRC